MEFPIKSTQWISSCVNQIPIFRGLNPHVSSCISIYHHVLVGGLGHLLSHIGNNHPNWLIFVRWVGWNHQPVYHCIIIYQHNIIPLDGEMKTHQIHEFRFRPLHCEAPCCGKRCCHWHPAEWAWGLGQKLGWTTHDNGDKPPIYGKHTKNCDDSGMVQLAWFYPHHTYYLVNWFLSHISGLYLC